MHHFFFPAKKKKKWFRFIISYIFDEMTQKPGCVSYIYGRLVFVIDVLVYVTWLQSDYRGAHLL